jgi:hypothetical protein
MPFRYSVQTIACYHRRGGRARRLRFQPNYLTSEAEVYKDYLIHGYPARFDCEVI